MYTFVVRTDVSLSDSNLEHDIVARLTSLSPLDQSFITGGGLEEVSFLQKNGFDLVLVF